MILDLLGHVGPCSLRMRHVTRSWMSVIPGVKQARSTALERGISWYSLCYPHSDADDKPLWRNPLHRLVMQYAQEHSVGLKLWLNSSHW